MVDALDIQRSLLLFDLYWTNIFRKHLPTTCRAWAREVQDVRNRVAHLGGTDFNNDETWRALDTMLRLCKQINAEKAEKIQLILDRLKAQQAEKLRQEEEALLKEEEAKLRKELGLPDAPITKSSFKLLKTDGNNNEYHVCPGNDELFKEEAFHDGGIFVRIEHPDGYTETQTRRVGKIWTTTVYWNLNSMTSQYNRDIQHISKANNLKVYACPMRYIHMDNSHPV